jgi:hypothetical protein
MAEEEDEKVEQDLEWKPVPLHVHLKFAIEKMTEEAEKATEEMIRRMKKAG